MNNELSMQGKVVFIQGAGRYPGNLLARAFAARGATIAACDVTPVLLDPLVQAIQAEGGQIKAYIGDVSRGMPARSLVDEVLSDWERVDILINNPRVAPTTSVLEMDEWDWQHTLEVNLSGPFLLTKLVSRMMIEQGQGVILNIAAGGSHLETAGRSAYAASQVGLLALTRSAAQELIAYNIRIYALCLDEAELQSAPASEAPGSPKDTISELALFLCSPAASHLPGQVFRIGPSVIPGLSVG